MFQSIRKPVFSETKARSGQPKKKLAQPLAIVAGLVLLGIGAGTVWIFRDQPTTAPKPGEYDVLVEKLGSDEPAIRNELNELICTATAAMDPADKTKAHALTLDCLDVRLLLDIGHVRAFLAGQGEGMAYHFVSEEHRSRLKQIAGDRPSPQKVLAVRQALLVMGNEFASLREPPEFKLKIEGASPPAMPFLAILRDSHLFRPGQQPIQRGEPRIPAFSSADAGLLVQLEQFFNCELLAKAFPATKYPKLYRNGRIPALPANLMDYQSAIVEAVLEEKRLLLPGETPDPEGVEAVNEVYLKLERFFSAIVSFEK